MLPAGSFGGNTWLNSAKPLSSLASSMLKQNMHVMPTIKKMVRFYTNCYTAWFTNDIDDYIINYIDQNISNASFVNGKIICTWCQVCLRGTGRSSHVGSSKIWNWTRIHDVKYDARFPSKRWSDPPMQHQLQLSNIINTPIFLGKGTGEKKTHFSIPTSEMFRVLLQSFDLLFSLCVSFFIGHPTIKALLGQRFLVGQHRGQFLLGRFTVGAQIQHSFLQIWAGLALELLICGFLHLVKSDLEILGEIMTMK